MKKAIFLYTGAGFLCAGLLAGGFYAAGLDENNRLGLLSGFEPGAAVAYTVTTAQGEIAAAGENIIDTQGGFEIRSDPAIAKDKTALNYDIRIDRAREEPLNIRFETVPETGEVLVAGRGLEEFSDVKIEHLDGKKIIGTLETRTDWAGIFGESAEKTEKSEHLRLAFYGNIASDVQSQSPYVIQVQAGGGNYTNAIKNGYNRAFQYMTEQLSAVMMQQAAIIGTFFDAGMQLETQRAFQKLQAEAHKDYHPSEQMCQFGTFMRSVAQTEAKSAHDKAVINKTLLEGLTNEKNNYASEGLSSEIAARMNQFRTVYCDPQDNNNGLKYMCDHDQDGDLTTGPIGGQDRKRLNKDIDFTRTVEAPLTLGIDFTDTVLEHDEEDVLALAKNLYWPAAFEPVSERRFDEHNSVGQMYTNYMDARQVMAMQNVAHNSFANIVAMKAKTHVGPNAANGPSFMKALMREFNMPDQDIDAVLGQYPSYYAQMEVLAKKIYQNPDFYTNLYDKPANIDRIGVSMDAIKLMQARDAYETALRKEMLTSLMVEEALDKHYRRLDTRIAGQIR